MEEIGRIYRKDRDVYIILSGDGESYRFNAGTFSMMFTRFAEKGCRVTDMDKIGEALQ